MSKRLRSSDVCADCNGPDPSWASVNRGTFICDECCSVHRSLGRHISQVRHLKHTAWPPTLLQMVETLYNNGANSIWEHSLLDPASIMSGRRKANPQDKVHPNKAEFIRAKYQMLAFVHRLPCREDDSVTAKDLSTQHSTESQDNDQPDYDSVASDEDTDVETRASKANRQKSLDSDLSDGPVTVQEFMEVKSALVASEAKRQQLMKVNNNLSDELRIMQKKLQTLQSENSSLRRQATASACQVQTGSDHKDTASHSSLKRRPSARGSRPMSMYETGSGQKPYLPMGEASHPEESRTRLQPFPTHIGRSALVTSSSSLPSFPSTLSWSRDESARRASRLEKQNSTPESDYDNTACDPEPDDTGSTRKGRQRSMLWQGDGLLPDTAEPHSVPSPTLPSTEDVIRKTEQITKNIQELLRAAQENKHDSTQSVLRLQTCTIGYSESATCCSVSADGQSPCRALSAHGSHHACGKRQSYIPCSERIHVAVTEMAALFPKKPKSDTVRTSLRLLTSSAYRLQSECRKALPGDSSLPTDVQLVTQQVIQCAYDIAKAAKQLVTITTKENSS